MSNDITPATVTSRSALRNLTARIGPVGEAGLSIEERPLLEYVNLRAQARDPLVGDVLPTLVGAPLPTAANTVTSTPAHAIYWLGPDEWLIQSLAPVSQPCLAEALRIALQDTFSSSVDVSSGYTAVKLQGPQARALLQKGCPLDLHPKVMRVGHCAQSHYFKAGILLRPVAQDDWEVVVRRSYADYFSAILLDAAWEYSR